MSHSPIYVTKADGTSEQFDTRKLDDSLTQVGTTEHVREHIVRHMAEKVHSGMSTEEIYRHSFEMLQKEDKQPVAARYSLKRALFALGPSGYPFERFLGEVLRAHGWHVQTGVAMTGRCAPHEVDVLAEKHGRRIGIEAKFHNTPGTVCDIKDALYVHARYEDLRRPRIGAPIHEGWLVTNTRFSRNAIRYGRCVGLGLIGWDYPHGKGLSVLIEHAGVHPLTCLTSLSEGEKRRLLEGNIVLCKTITSERHLLQEYGVSPSKATSVLEEAEQLCTPLRVRPMELPVSAPTHG